MNKDVHIPNNTAPQQMLDFYTNIMWRDTSALPFDRRFNYISVLGKLNFLEKSTIPDIAYVMHKHSHFSQDTIAFHRDVIIYLVKCLKARSTQGITLDPEGNKSFEVYTYANFCGN